jgi:hypothetical protein
LGKADLILQSFTVPGQVCDIVLQVGDFIVAPFNVTGHRIMKTLERMFAFFLFSCHFPKLLVYGLQRLLKGSLTISSGRGMVSAARA